VLVRVLEATWYLLAGKVTNVDRSFRQWFALANWTSLPAVIGVVPAALALLMASGSQIDPGVLQPLSLNELFFHRKMGEPGYQVLSNISLLGMIGAALAIIGVKSWSSRSWLFASVFVLLPVAVILGIWALIALR
jgi:Yip1 domain